MLQFVGYCSCPLPLHSSQTFREQGIDPIMEQFVARKGVDVRGSFLAVPDRKSIVSNLQPVPSVFGNLTVSTAKLGVLDTAAQAETYDKLNVAAVLCGDGKFLLSSKSYFDSSSLDGAVSCFWPLDCDSINITWAPKMHFHFSTGSAVP